MVAYSIRVGDRLAVGGVDMEKHEDMQPQSQLSSKLTKKPGQTRK